MTVEEFARALVTVRRRYHGTVTSWGRDDGESIGIGNGPHGWDLGADMVYRDGGHRVPNRPGSERHPRFPSSCPHCSEEGLKCLHEGSHDHYQPADFPAGGVSQYHGGRRDWLA